MFDKIIKQENYNFELVDNFWQVKDRAGNLITQLINNVFNIRQSYQANCLVFVISHKKSGISGEGVESRTCFAGKASGPGRCLPRPGKRQSFHNCGTLFASISMD